jgi:hypothetical protein
VLEPLPGDHVGWQQRHDRSTPYGDGHGVREDDAGGDRRAAGSPRDSAPQEPHHRNCHDGNGDDGQVDPDTRRQPGEPALGCITGESAILRQVQCAAELQREEQDGGPASSLAVFLTPDSERTFRLPNQLSQSVEVSDRFHVSPLMRAVTFPQAAHVLALSKGAVDFEAVLPGTIDETSGAVTFADAPSADTYGILDEIARRVHLTGGRVLAVRNDDIPQQTPVAAILRYTP